MDRNDRPALVCTPLFFFIRNFGGPPVAHLVSRSFLQLRTPPDAEKPTAAPSQRKHGRQWRPCRRSELPHRPQRAFRFRRSCCCPGDTLAVYAWFAPNAFRLFFRYSVYFFFHFLKTFVVLVSPNRIGVRWHGGDSRSPPVQSRPPRRGRVVFGNLLALSSIIGAVHHGPLSREKRRPPPRTNPRSPRLPHP